MSDELDLSKDPLVLQCYKALRTRPSAPRQRVERRSFIQHTLPDEPLSHLTPHIDASTGWVYYVSRPFDPNDSITTIDTPEYWGTST